MAEYKEISEKAKGIVEKFFNVSDLSTFDVAACGHKTLPVSLYALMPDADDAILEPLTGYRLDLTEKLDNEEISVLKKEFPAVVRFCYEQYNLRNPIYLDSLIEICRSSVFTPKQGSKILLPYAGEARFIYDYGEHSFDGYEPEPEAWAYSQMLCSAYSTNAEIQLGDSLENHEGEKYDYIFTMPFGRKNVGAIVEELYNIAEERLENEGCLCCVLPARFCYAPEWQGLRKILIDKSDQYSAAVMSLPELLLNYTQEENVCVFWLYKGIKGQVILMNAKDGTFFSGYGDEPAVNIKIQSIFETLKMGDDRYVWYGLTSDLSDDVCLLPTRYLIDRYVSYSSSKGKRWVRLDDIVELAEGTKMIPGKDNREIISVSFHSLSSDYLNCNISSENSSSPLSGPMPLLLSNEGYLSETRKITDSCLLAGFYNKRVKVGRFDNSSDSYSLFDVFGHEFIPFKLKSDIVSEDFMLRSIMSEEVGAQAEILPWELNDSIDPEDFLQIMISVPSKEEQERICKEEAQERIKGADQKLKDAFKDFREDMHMKRHAIGQTIFDFNNWWNELQDARSENVALTDKTIVGDSTVKDIYDRLQDALSRLQQQIYKLDRGNGLTAEDFALTTSIEEFIENHQSPIFEFEYNVEKHHVNEDVPDYKRVEVDRETGQLKVVRDGWICKKGDPRLDEYVNFPREALAMVLENIVSNACSHGFTDSSEGNKIRVDFEWIGGYVVATVANNGKSLNEGLSPNEVFLYGKSSKSGNGHYGLGGYEIKRLMQEFGGDAEIESTPLEEFTVSYKLTFPEALAGWHSYEMNILPPSPNVLGNEPDPSEQTDD